MLNVEKQFTERQLEDFEFVFKRRVDLKNFLISEGAVFTDRNRTQCLFCGKQEVGVGYSKKKGLQMWGCYSCREYGTIIEWVMKKYGLSREDAIIYIKEKTGEMNGTKEKPEDKGSTESKADNDLDEIKRYPLPKYLKAQYGIELDSGGKGLCPLHDDKHPSLSVWCNGQGIWLWKCFACNITGTSIDFTMKKEGILFEEAIRILKERLNINSRPEGYRIEREHIYKDAEGQEIFKKVKYENGWAFFHKTNEGWKKNKGDHEPIPYNLDKFEDHKGKEVIVCEGEKDAETVTNLGIGFLGTSALWGQGNWSPELTKHFKDFGTIFFLYDVGNEENAGKHAGKLKTAYPDKKIFLMKLPMEEKEADITDYLELEENEDKIMTFLDLQGKAEEIGEVPETEESDLHIEHIKVSKSPEIEEPESQIKVEAKPEPQIKQIKPEVKPEVKKEEPQVQTKVKPDSEKKEARIKTVEEILKEPKLTIELLIDPLVERNGFTLIGGVKGIGKSLFLLNLALHYVLGEDFLDNKIVKPGKILLIQQEISEPGMQDRIRKITSEKQFKNLSDIPVYTRTRDPLKITDKKDFEEIKKKIEEFKPDILALDPLARFNPLEENYARSMSSIVDRINRLKTEYRIAVVVVHHISPKQNPDNPNTPTELAGLFRGHSVLADSADTLVGLFRLPRQQKQQALSLPYEHYATIEIERRHGEKPKRYAIERGKDSLIFRPSEVWDEIGKKIMPKAIVDLIKASGGKMSRKDVVSYYSDPLRPEDRASHVTVDRAIDEAERQGMIESTRIQGKGYPKVLKVRNR